MAGPRTRSRASGSRPLPVSFPWSRPPLDRRLDYVSPLGPGAVVVEHSPVAEQVLENEPGQAGALADAAIGDDFLVAADVGSGVERLELGTRLERSVLVAVLPPRDVLRAGDVHSALAGLGQAGRRQQRARE